MATKFQLTYKKGIRCGNERYSIAIPDNFVLEKGAEDRAFIAWLPDGADEYLCADITFFDGKTVSESNDFCLYTPELCAALLENMFWTNPLLRMMYKNAKFIPLSDGYPAGGINAGYDEDNFQYNIQVFFKDCIKTMRVQVMNVTKDDILDCDKMVVDWIKTMQMTEPMGIAKELDDPSFVSQKLTEGLVAEWKSCSDIRYTMILQTLQNKITARAARYKATLGDGSDSEKDVRKDDQVYVDAAAVSFKLFLTSALNGLEAITKKNAGNELLQKLYAVICPAIMESDSVVMGNLGGIKGEVSAPIPGYAELKSRFLSLMPDAEDRVEKKLPNPNFVMPTYNEKKEVLVGTMVATLPDHMLIAEEYHDEDASSEEFLDQLRSRYSLVAIPDDFEKGFDFYTEGALCINISKPQQVPQFAALFDKKAQKNAGVAIDVPSNLVNIVEGLLKQNGKYNAQFPAEYVCGGDDYGIVVEQVEENIDPIENWSQFTFVIFHQSNVLQGNVYINALGKREQFSAAVKEWLKTFKVADKKTIAAYNKKQLASALKQCNLAAKDDKIDAVKVSQLFFDDVFFMNDYEVENVRNHNIVTKVQFNADVRNDYPTILANLNLFGPAVKEVLSAIESKENLIIKKADYHKYLQEVTWNRDITGSTIFNLCAYHMLKIVHQADDVYVVAIDSNLIDGLPEAYAYVAEFIRELRDYNGLTGAFTAVMASMGNLNGGISRNIDHPIADAAKHESSVSITVAKGEYPYTQICKEKAEARKKAKAEEKAKRDEKLYQDALQNMCCDDEKIIQKALSDLQSLKDYRDAKEQAAICFEKLKRIKAEKERKRQEEKRKAEEERKRREEERKRREEEERKCREEEERQRRLAEEERIRAKKAKQKRVVIILLAAAAIAVAAYLAITLYFIPNNKYSAAEALLAEGKKAEAAMMFGSAGNYSDSRERSFVLWDEVANRDTLAAGGSNHVGESFFGGISKTGDPLVFDTEGEVSAEGGDYIAVAAGNHDLYFLKADGTVPGCPEWKNIVDIASGGDGSLFGLKSDGTVVAQLSISNIEGYTDGFENWTNIIDLAVGYDYLVGLKADGTVVTTGFRKSCDNYDGELNVGGWTDIVEIAVGSRVTLGLKADGTVVAVGSNYYYTVGGASKWTDIVDITAFRGPVAGLQADGTVVIAGASGDNNHGESGAISWSDIVMVESGNYYVLGIQSDGTILVAGKLQEEPNPWPELQGLVP